MERWEHMAIYMELVPQDVTYKQSSVLLLRPDGTIETMDRDATAAAAVSILNQLGLAGWRLVETEHQVYSTSSTRVLWLQRPKS